MRGLNRPPARREYALIVGLTLLCVFAQGLAGYKARPAYTDAYYYHNAAARLAGGEGLTDPYVALTYIGARDALPQPSHLYWMPLTSVVVALGIGGLGPWVMGLLWAALATVAFWCGAYLGRTRRHAWTAGLLAIFSGFYAPFWLQPDTFALYGVTGSLALIGMGLGRARRDWRWFAFGGAMAGLAHLTRADGALLTGVLALVALWPDTSLPTPLSRLRATIAARLGASRKLKASGKLSEGIICAGAGLLAYALVMTPWLLRNASVSAPLLPAGAATIWLRGYDEIVNYPPDGLTLQRFLDWGLGNIVASRWEALVTNAQRFIAEQGLAVLWPFMLVGLWRRRNEPLLSGVWVYALALHAAMTFVFAYPGMRGGLFHSSTTLLPFWFSLGALGIDDAVDWAAARRRHWDAAQAQAIFTAALVVIMIALTLSILAARLPQWNTAGEQYIKLKDILPDDAVVMSNDPAALYYHTGLPGVVVPNGGVETVRALCEKYRVTRVILDVNRTAPLNDLYLGREQADFLEAIIVLGGEDDDPANDVRVFEANLP